MKIFNTNSYVMIKLNPFGVEILKQKGVEIPERDKDGYCKMQMWTVMNIFGEYMTVYLDPPFEQDILIDDKYLETK